MFSPKTQWEQSPNPLAEAWARRRSIGHRTYDLTESNPTRCAFRYPEEEILAALADPRGLRYDPHPAGLPAAREAVAAFLSREETVEPSGIVLTASTSEAYGWLLKLLCGPGDRVLVPRPSYPLFDYLAGLEDVALDPWPLRYERGWRVDLEAMRSAIGPRTRAIIAVHPNNPTGSVIAPEEAAAIGRTCEEQDLALISDEVFLDYSFRPAAEAPKSLATSAVSDLSATSAPSDLTGTSDVSATSAPSARCLTFALGGLSKSVGLPQIKVGWIRVAGPKARVAEALARLEVIADTYLSVNTPAQHALPSLLRSGDAVRSQILTRVRSNREWLARRAARADAGWELLEADGGWSAVLRVPRIRTEEEWCLELVERDGVLVHPGWFFDFESEAFLVASLLPPEEEFREALERVAQRIEEG